MCPLSEVPLYLYITSDASMVRKQARCTQDKDSHFTSFTWFNFDWRGGGGGGGGVSTVDITVCVVVCSCSKGHTQTDALVCCGVNIHVASVFGLRDYRSSVDIDRALVEHLPGSLAYSNLIIHTCDPPTIYACTRDSDTSI